MKSVASGVRQIDGVCYFCREYFYSIRSHLIPEPDSFGALICPHDWDQRTQYLQPHELTKVEQAMEVAWEKNR